MPKNAFGYMDDDPYNASSIRVPLPPSDKRPPHLVAVPVDNLRQMALTAASKRIPDDAKTQGRLNHRGTHAGWQNEAWAIYDQVGELHYAANLYANGLSRLVLELQRESDGDEPQRLCDLKDGELTDTDKLVRDILAEITSEQCLGEMQRIWGLNKFVTGECLLVGLPRKGLSRRKRKKSEFLNYTWAVYSRNDVIERAGILLICGEEYDPASVILIRVWQPHPRLHREADSPVRSSLPILRELIGLTMFVSALIDSRLAGAGVLLLPTSATVLGGTAPEDDQEEDPTVAALIDNMITPIKDRDSAASVVPLVLTAPDESVGAIRHISFASPLEGAAKELRDEAIRRLALGLDMPPEQLLGLGSASHWSAWLVAEDTVRYQLIPGLSLFGTALMTELIQPILLEMGIEEDEAFSYSFAIATDNLIQRPNKFDEAFELYKLDAITLPAVLQAGGFELKDAPDQKAVADRAVDLALKAVGINPSLYQDPGLPNLVSQLRAVLAGQDASNAPDTALPPAAQPTQAPAGGSLEPGPKETNTKPTQNGDNRPGPAKSTPSGPDKN